MVVNEFLMNFPWISCWFWSRSVPLSRPFQKTSERSTTAAPCGALPWRAVRWRTQHPWSRNRPPRVPRPCWPRLEADGGGWWRVFILNGLDIFLTPYPDNFWYVYTYTGHIYIYAHIYIYMYMIVHVYLCVWELNTSWTRHLVVWWRTCTFLGLAVLGFPIV